MQPESSARTFVGLFNGEAVTLWRLHRRSGWIRCFVAEWPAAFWFGIECAGGELLASETMPTIDAVLARATDTRAALLGEGWLEE